MEARVVKAAQPEYPPSVRRLKLGPVSSLVVVTIGPSGNIVSASTWKSSGNHALDESAMSAARKSQYSAKVVNCQATTGRYLFRADFMPDTPSPECVARDAVADDDLLIIEKVKKLQSEGHVSEAIVLYDKTKKKGERLPATTCSTVGFYLRVAKLNALVVSFLGNMSLDARHDAMSQCAAMHQASAEYYVAKGWANLFIASRMIGLSSSLPPGYDRAYRDILALAQRVNLTLLPLTASQNQAREFLARFTYFDTPGCDLRFQPKQNGFG
ncbi:MAG: energy transducer TonB [Candidatus Tumulicola sp.]